MDWQAIFRSNKFTNSIVLCAFCCCAGMVACMVVCACVHYRKTNGCSGSVLWGQCIIPKNGLKYQVILDFSKIVSSFLTWWQNTKLCGLVGACICVSNTTPPICFCLSFNFFSFSINIDAKNHFISVFNLICCFSFWDMIPAWIFQLFDTER